MHHWHEKHCAKPDVRLPSDGILRCAECLASLDVAQVLAVDAAAGSSVLDIPPDQKLGEMRLWWPPSVRYHSASALANDMKEDAPPPQAASADQRSSPAYSRRLASNEIRLICIPAAAPEDPVHLTLEIYSLDDCPEYETVSYTWAGEDGDGRPSKPVFVGPHWDVLAQTRNCWAMLRFMRPWRGTRMLWVDAVCINQDDTAERNSQVANMGGIYSACSRVVVYLGPDVAVPLHGRHPRRRRLHELETGAVTPRFGSEAPPCDLAQLLKRRYFSRIWVIQELLLSPKVVIRIGDVDFSADPAMLTHFSTALPDWNWDKTRAPWVRHMAQSGSGIKTFRDVMLLSTFSQATDPRDRLFGLLGIMSGLSGLLDKDPDAPELSPEDIYADYSLSCQHVFIGLFAYCLLNMRRPQIFYHASCRRSRALGLPSWTPDWKSSTTWSIMFRTPNFRSAEVFDSVREMIRQKHAAVDPSAGKYGREPDYSLYEIYGPGDPHIEKYLGWYDNAYVDFTSGAMYVNATHFATLSHPIEKIGTLRGFSVFEMKASRATLYLMSEHALQHSNPDWHVFVLNVPDRPKIYLVLEALDKVGKYRLISACPFVLVRVPRTDGRGEVPRMLPLPFELVQNSLHRVLDEMDVQLDTDWHPADFYTNIQLFPGATTLRDYLPFLLDIYDSPPDIGGDDLANLYMPVLDQKLSPQIKDGWIVFTVVSVSWESHANLQDARWADIIGLPHTHHSWEYTVETDPLDDATLWDDGWVSAASHGRIVGRKRLSSSPGRPVHVRYPLARVQSSLAHARVYHKGVFGVLHRLAHAADMSGESLQSMLERERRSADAFTGCPASGTIQSMRMVDLWTQLGTDGSTGRIGIA